MNSSPTHPISDTVRWLAAHTNFPANRLEFRAETMLLMAALAAEEEAADVQRFHLERRVGAQTSALRSHNLRRSQVHFKCDNSAKV
jgi:hypothetical protein